jgi:hypothetical protein
MAAMFYEGSRASPARPPSCPARYDGQTADLLDLVLRPAARCLPCFRDCRFEASLRCAESPVVLMILDEQLQQFLGQERELSRRLQQLDRRIQYLRGPGAYDPGAVELLDRLILEEQDESQKRQVIQANIDRLRA